MRAIENPKGIDVALFDSLWWHPLPMRGGQHPPLAIAMGASPRILDVWQGSVFAYVPPWAKGMAPFSSHYGPMWDIGCPLCAATVLAASRGTKAIDFHEVSPQVSPSSTTIAIDKEGKYHSYPECGLQLATWSAMITMLKESGVEVRIVDSWDPTG